MPAGRRPLRAPPRGLDKSTVPVGVRAVLQILQDDLLSLLPPRAAASASAAEEDCVAHLLTLDGGAWRT
ncbi:hypothetical protein E2C01_096467 [Portunus trituberculatus]|uniref:Uncharacterized protein n=1 Tax=Portunus trituberculatus TaxID=210409 RepID=A0A5B7K1U1_PORTR|nr:hypothetical protein [Portunus trituberculatus]